jgi:hypothetical protein
LKEVELKFSDAPIPSDVDIFQTNLKKYNPSCCARQAGSDEDPCCSKKALQRLYEKNKDNDQSWNVLSYLMVCCVMARPEVLFVRWKSGRNDFSDIVAHPKNRCCQPERKKKDEHKLRPYCCAQDDKCCTLFTVNPYADIEQNGILDYIVSCCQDGNNLCCDKMSAPKLKSIPSEQDKKDQACCSTHVRYTPDCCSEDADGNVDQTYKEECCLKNKFGSEKNICCASRKAWKSVLPVDEATTDSTITTVDEWSAETFETDEPAEPPEKTEMTETTVVQTETTEVSSVVTQTSTEPGGVCGIGGPSGAVLLLGVLVLIGLGMR